MDWDKALRHHHARMDHHVEFFKIHGGGGRHRHHPQQSSSPRDEAKHSPAADVDADAAGGTDDRGMDAAGEREDDEHKASSSSRCHQEGGGARASVHVRVPDEPFLEMVADLLGAQWGYDGTWPEPAGGWHRLGRMFASTDFPTARSKALFFAVCSVAGYEACLMAAATHAYSEPAAAEALGGSSSQKPSQCYGWKDVEAALGVSLVTQFRERAAACGQAARLVH
eukprot:CAMPEP_0170183232 /NCGR_PEP_ID=MMETSP0040_2-20121228/30028_1 /TAXON_ID=641309 /ORGANISM="Lotharella oceanica, Strain CCMP622" /LENGTH=224 /DNA_ID=CAMNT_0010428903 /DNA_START=150 /DNA_END=824 /DNA_ORIENTATION=-